MRLTVRLVVHIHRDPHRWKTVTRTMPVGNGGKFTPEARAIHELVLEMQRVCYLSMYARN